MLNDESKKIIEEYQKIIDKAKAAAAEPKPYAQEWCFADAFTVDQAAFLWCGLEPFPKYHFSNSQTPQGFEAVKQGLIAAIELKTLSAQKQFSAFRTDGEALVFRDALKAYAESKKVYPAFLFDTVAPITNENNSIKNKGGAPAEYEWDKVFAGVVWNADLNNLPKTLDALTLEMIQFVENGYSFQVKDSAPKKAPSETTMKDRLRPIVTNLKALGWTGARDGNPRSN